MKNIQPPTQTQVAQKPPKRPNDVGAIAVTGAVRIFDPQSQKTFVEKQG
jgi:hypothetical protein